MRVSFLLAAPLSGKRPWTSHAGGGNFSVARAILWSRITEMKSGTKTPRQRWTARTKSFLRWVHHNERWHGAAAVLLFILALVGWRHLAWSLEATVVAVVVVNAMLLALVALARNFHHAHLHHHLRHLLEVFHDLPSEGRLRQYRLRRIGNGRSIGTFQEPNEEDLGAFVSLSHLNLLEAHPHFSVVERTELYRRWWLLNKDSFLLLEHLDLDGKFKIVAVSIVLPLFPKAFQALKEGQIAVLDLREGDIVPQPDGIRHLLIDTWIIDKPSRPKIGGTEYALVLKHLSMFWEASNQDDMTILIEPDVRSIRKLAINSEFHGPWKTKDGGNLYAFRFPHDFHYADPRLRALFEQIRRNIDQTRSWNHL
jgi:hypothetical protein